MVREAFPDRSDIRYDVQAPGDPLKFETDFFGAKLIFERSYLCRSLPTFADLCRNAYRFRTQNKTCRRGPVAAPLCGNHRAASSLDISDSSRDPGCAGLVERGGVSQRQYRRRSAKVGEGSAKVSPQNWISPEREHSATPNIGIGSDQRGELVRLL